VEKQLLQQFGQRVRHLRQQHGLSQEKFAELCTVHYSVIRHFESGRRDVRFTTLVRISHAFGVTMSELLDGIEKGTPAKLPRGAGSALDKTRLRAEIATLEKAVANLKRLESAEEPKTTTTGMRRRKGSA
jgi:transcriptional regulator with XRE-family HTH domain